MVTHKDIARAVGVSQATVSKVLSNKSNNISISQKTRMAVIQAAKDLGYNQNKVASGLIQLVQKSVAILVEHIGNPFAGVIMNGMEEELVGHDYHFMFASSGGNPDHSRNTIESLSRRYTTGFILMPFYSSNTSQSVHRYLKSRGIPFVQTNYYNLPGKNDAPLVCTNNYEIFKQLTEHLISLGHERIALFYTSDDYSSNAQRVEGYKAALTGKGLKIDNSLMVKQPRKLYFDLAIKRTLLSRWLKRQNRPTAIMCVKDDCALQFIRLVEDLGLKVPGDIAVTGFDDYRHYIPNIYPLDYHRLTTVRQNLPEIGRQAVRRLIQQIETQDNNPPPLEVLVPAKLIIRGSCGGHPKDIVNEPNYLELPGLGQGHLTF